MVGVISSANGERSRLAENKVWNAKAGKSETVQGTERSSHNKETVKNRTLINDKQIRKYGGIIDLSCITLKNAAELKENIEKVLATLKVNYTTKGFYVLNCEKNDIKFVVEIMKLKKALNYLKIRRISGAMKEYKVLVTKLLNYI